LFHRRRTRPLTLALVAVVAVAWLTEALPAQTSPPGKNVKRTTLTGRVLAEVLGLSDYHLVGEGFNVKVFILRMETSQKPGALPSPVKVEYQFFKWQPTLPDTFFDYSKRYELRVVRDPSCDQTLDQLSYMEAEDESGKPLGRDYVLRPLEGAPKELLKPELLLPCYVLTPGNYKALTESKQSGALKPGDSFRDRPTEGG